MYTYCSGKRNVIRKGILEGSTPIFITLAQLPVCNNQCVTDTYLGANRDLELKDGGRSTDMLRGGSEEEEVAGEMVLGWKE